MFTKWEQIESWIKDNNLAHWVFYRTNPAEMGEKKENNIIVDSNYYTGDEADKLEMTRKYLASNGGRAWGVGFRTPNSTTGGLVCDVRLEDIVSNVAGVGINPLQQVGAPIDEAAIEKRVEARLRAEMEKAEYAKRLADLDKREKEFAEQQASAMGAITKIFAPIGQAWLQNHMMRNVAGVDAEEPVHAAPIQPIVPDGEQPADQQEPSLLTPEDEDKWYNLIERFVKVEPRALELMESVVTMAESGDVMYGVAKKSLLK